MHAQRSHRAYGAVVCALRGSVGERREAVLVCEALHERRAPVEDGSWSGGVAAVQRALGATACPGCGAGERVGRLEARLVYDTADGDLHPGDLYWSEAGHGGGACPPATGAWANCPGRHLHAVLPNGHHWDLDARASNCTLPDDRLHRCWVRHGEPPAITVDKDGLTCRAGRGSVASGDYHGLLRDGVFTDVGPRPAAPPAATA